MKKHNNLSIEKKQARYGYIFVLPFVIGFIIYVAYPLIKAVQFSFSDLTVGAVTYNIKGVGFEHYRRILFIDPNFRKTIIGSVGNMLFNVPVVVLFSFFMASLLNQKFKGRTLFRAILFLPIILASGLIVTITSLGDFITSNMNNIGSLSGNSTGAMFTEGITNFLMQMNVGNEIISLIENLVSRISEITTMSAVPTIVFLSGMQSISPSVFEASYIEGASGWDVFWKITFPMVSPLLLVNAIYCIVDSFTSATNTAITSIHVAMFEKFEYGLASAMSLFYLAIVGIIIALIFSLVRRLIVYYD